MKHSQCYMHIGLGENKNASTENSISESYGFQMISNAMTFLLLESLNPSQPIAI